MQARNSQAVVKNIQIAYLFHLFLDYPWICTAPMWNEIALFPDFWEADLAVLIIIFSLGTSLDFNVFLLLKRSVTPQA